MSQFPFDVKPDKALLPPNGPPLPRAGPRLQDPVQFLGDASMRDTPDVATDIDQRLDINDSSEDIEIDSLSDASSVEDETQKPPVGLPLSKLPTGLCYDERMRYHSEVSATTGENVHPEDPRRIYYIFKELCQAGLVADGTNAKPIVDQPLQRIDAREATREECCLIHTPWHYDFVKRTAGMPPNQRCCLLPRAIHH